MRTRRELVNTGEPIAVYIGRCARCRRGYRWDVPEEVRVTNPYIVPGTPTSYRLPLSQGMPTCDCRAAEGIPRTWIKFEPLNATYVERVRCTSICKNAVSITCGCQCGGANHGRGEGRPPMKDKHETAPCRDRGRAIHGPCEGPPSFQVVFRNRTTRAVLDTEGPFCFQHALTRVTRAQRAASAADAEFEPIPAPRSS